MKPLGDDAFHDIRDAVRALCAHVPGPDFPTEAEIITPREELARIYETGNGSVRMRARWEREQGDVVITALPYQVPEMFVSLYRGRV